MEALDQNAIEDNNHLKNEEINKYLLETAKWGKFLAILGYIGLGILVIASFVMMFTGKSMQSGMPGSTINFAVLGVFYLLFGLLNYFPITYLYKFCIQVKQGIESEDSDSYTSAFSNLKSLFKFIGILTIVMLVIYILVIFFAIAMM